MCPVSVKNRIMFLLTFLNIPVLVQQILELRVYSLDLIDENLLDFNK